MNRFLAVTFAIAAASPALAHDRGRVFFGFSSGPTVYYPPAYYRPPPVYYAPPAAYYPPPTYYAPPPVYYAPPSYYGPPTVYYRRGW